MIPVVSNVRSTEQCHDRSTTRQHTSYNSPLQALQQARSKRNDCYLTRIGRNTGAEERFNVPGKIAEVAGRALPMQVEHARLDCTTIFTRSVCKICRKSRQHKYKAPKSVRILENKQRGVVGMA